MLAGAAAAYFATRSSDQAQVSADVLPVVRAAQTVNEYVDCSKIGAVAYDEHNPCQTFVLLQSSHFASAAAFLAAEARLLQARGWREATPPLAVDFDAANAQTASASESWAQARQRACAYVTTGRAGVAAEAKALFPYDPYNQPSGVLDFYRGAKAAKGPTLWVRLQPQYINGQQAC